MNAELALLDYSALFGSRTVIGVVLVLVSHEKQLPQFVIIKRKKVYFSLIVQRRISPMSDAVKKTTKKAATTATKAKAPAKAGKKAAATNGHAVNVAEFRVPHDQIAMLAHQYWNDGGRQDGHDAEDWLRAEQELRARVS
jgi:hypothetical protein